MLSWARIGRHTLVCTDTRRSIQSGTVRPTHVRRGIVEALASGACMYCTEVGPQRVIQVPDSPVQVLVDVDGKRNGLADLRIKMRGISGHIGFPSQREQLRALANLEGGNAVPSTSPSRSRPLSAWMGMKSRAGRAGRASD